MIEQQVKTETEAQREVWNDQLEAVQFTTQVFAKLHDQLGVDLVLARLDEETKRFIIESVKQAFALDRQLPMYKTTATKQRDGSVHRTREPLKGAKQRKISLFNTMVTESLMLAILNRNVEKNVLLNIIGRTMEDFGKQDEPEPETLGGEALKRIKGNKNNE